jgi:SAM-dependent methyltransferase
MKNAKAYWENKILKWEKSRYSNPFLSNLRARMKISEKIILQRMLPQQTILELGCGSGILAERLLRHSFRYFGVDIAENAVSLAKERCAFAGDRGNFFAKDVLHFEMKETDLTVFLGLTDWLSEFELEQLFKSLKSDKILFSYTVDNTSHRYPWYRIYRRFADKNYHEYGCFARTFSFEQISRMARAGGFSLEVLHKPQLFNPGVLLWGSR